MLSVSCKHKKKLFFTAILIASGTLLFGQPGNGNGNNGNGNGNKGSSGTLVFSPATLPDGQYGSSFKNLTLNVSGGKDPYSFSISEGGLPPGVSLSGDGVFSGVPRAAGNYSFTVSVKDHSKNTLSGSKKYSFIIDPAGVQVTANAATKSVGTPDPPFTYAVSGLVNGDNTGIFKGSLSRTPGETAGAYPITRGSVNAGGNYTVAYTGNYLTITKISQQITWTQSLLVGCQATRQVQLTATASSGLPVTYTVSDASVATVSGNVLTLVNPGTAVITANQAGNAEYPPASAVSETLVYQPASLISQHWSDVLFFDNSSGDFTAWQWYKNGQAVPGATNPFYSDTPVLNGQYYVIATNKDSQQIQSCTLTVTGGAAIPGGIKAHPNPVNAGGIVIINSNYSNPALQGAVLQVVDVTGKVRQQLTVVKSSSQMTMPSDAGIYIVNLLLAGGQKASTNVLVVN